MEYIFLNSLINEKNNRFVGAEYISVDHLINNIEVLHKGCYSGTRIPAFIGCSFHICHRLAARFPSIALLSQCRKGLSALGSKLFGSADTGDSLGNEYRNKLLSHLIFCS